MDVIKVQTEIAQIGPDLGSVMSLVAQRAQELTSATSAVVELVEGDDMVYRAATGKAASRLGLRLKRHSSLSGYCVEQGTPVRCDDAETDPRVDHEACRLVGLRSMIVFPLKHGSWVAGVLKVLSPKPHFFDDDDVHVVAMMSDLIAAAIFHATRCEANELLRRATHDALTGLANRALFFDRLRQQLAQAVSNEERFGVIIIDMDGLKGINDGYGHRVGDAAIQELGSRIERATRHADTVARLGGDEFGVIMPRVGGRDNVRLACERVEAEVVTDAHLCNHHLHLSASVGTALYPDDGADIDTLLECADQAMYDVKRLRTIAR